MTSSKIFSDDDWKKETKLGNAYFSKKDYPPAYEHYKQAQALAQKLYTKFKDSEPLPNGLTPILVISYLNLSDYWAEQRRTSEQKDCLLEIYNLLSKQLNSNDASEVLYEQICQGLTKIYEEICHFFKSNNETLALIRVKAEYMTLVATGQHNLKHITH